MTATAAQLALVENAMRTNIPENLREALAAVLADAKAMQDFCVDYRMECDKETKALTVERDALRAERDALQRDAERYKFLRGAAPAHSVRWSRWRIEHWASPGPTWSDIRGEVLDTAIDAALARGGREMSVCLWSQDGEDCDTWATQCGGFFTIIDGTPAENDMRFCCYCGSALEQAPHEDDAAKDPTP